MAVVSYGGLSPAYDMPLFVVINLLKSSIEQAAEGHWTDDGDGDFGSSVDDSIFPAELLYDNQANRRSSPTLDASTTTWYWNGNSNYNDVLGNDLVAYVVGLFGHNFGELSGTTTVTIQVDDDPAFGTAQDIASWSITTSNANLVKIGTNGYSEVEHIRIKIECNDVDDKPRIGELIYGPAIMFEDENLWPLQPYDDEQLESKFAGFTSRGGNETRHSLYKRRRIFDYTFDVDSQAQIDMIRDVWHKTAGGKNSCLLIPKPNSAPTEGFWVKVPEKLNAPNTTGLFTRQRVSFRCEEQIPFQGNETYSEYDL